MHKNKICSWVVLLLVCASASTAQQDTLTLSDPPDYARVYLFGDSTNYVPDNAYLDVPDGSTIIISPKGHELLALHRDAIAAAWDSVNTARDALSATIATAVAQKDARIDSLVLAVAAADAATAAAQQQRDQLIASLQQLLASWVGGQ